MGFPGCTSGKKKKQTKNLLVNAGDMRVQSLGWEDPLGEGTATHSSILAWRIPWTEEPCWQRSVEPWRIRHDWSNLAHIVRNKDGKHRDIRLSNQSSLCWEGCFSVKSRRRWWHLLFSCSVMCDSVTPWTVARQAPLSMGLSRQKHWSELLFSPPGESSWPRDPVSLVGRWVLHHWCHLGSPLACTVGWL